MIIIGGINLLLFTVGLIYFLPKKTIQQPWSTRQQFISHHAVFLLLIFFVVILHLLEVNLLDDMSTKALGTDFTPVLQSIENGAVIWFSEHWTPPLTNFFVFIYIILYPFTLWFSIFVFIMTEEKKALKTFAVALTIIYAIALPFYLFFPITNVYTFFGSASALAATIPDVEQFFYTTTTHNNCFPSLHVALTVLIAQVTTLTENKRYRYFSTLYAVCVIISVIYLAIHWITDVLGGILLSLAAFHLASRFIKEK